MIFIVSALVGIPIFIYMVYYYKYLDTDNCKLPGYDGLPLIGVVPFLRKDFPIQLKEWGQRLGPVFSVKLLRQKWVILCNYRSIKEILIKHARSSSSRPLYINTPQNRDTFMLCGDVKNKKNYLVSLLRKQMGDGNKNAEYLIAEEVKYLNEALLEQIDKSFDVYSLLSKATANIILRIFTGRRRTYDDLWVQRYNEIVHKCLKDEKNAFYFLVVEYFKWLAYVPTFKSVAKQMRILNEKKDALFQEIIEECREALEKPSKLKPLLVQMLHDKKKMGNGFFREDILGHLVFELMIAGSDTSGTTILWCILYLLINPQVQQDIWKEINTRFQHGPPEMAGKVDMPLTSSFIDEMLRFKPVAPSALFHQTTAAIETDNYSIEKGVTLVPLLYAVHRDPEYFKDPNTFISDRFINKETGLYEKSKYLIPFGVGPRTCFGYKLAEMEIFMFLCGILQRFSVHCKDNEHPPDFDAGSFGFIYFPKPFQVLLRPRDETK